MEWIKKNPHQLALAVCSAGLIGSSALVLLNSLSLPEKFSGVRLSVPALDNVQPLELTSLQDAAKKSEKPAQWTATSENTPPLFISKRYIIQDGKVTAPEVGGVLTRFGPIPRKWFIDNNLNPFDPTVAKQDPDKDGFLNEDEFKFGNTDPNDAKAFPPYHTKLFLKQYIRVPFRLKFVAYDLDPKNAAKNSFQINTLDRQTPSEFLELGKSISKTKFRLDKFEQKFAINPKTGSEEDVSELTVTNTETGDVVVLVKDRITDSPDSIALFDYEWPNPPQPIQVKKLGEFVLRPNIQQRYKVLDIKDTEAVIQLPSGEKYTVPTPPKDPTR